MRLSEALNRLDHDALDNNTAFYDLRSMYEAIQPRLSRDDQKNIMDMAQKGDAEGIETYMRGVDSKLKQNSRTAQIQGKRLVADCAGECADEEEELEEDVSNLKVIAEPSETNHGSDTSVHTVYHVIDTQGTNDTGDDVYAVSPSRITFTSKDAAERAIDRAKEDDEDRFNYLSNGKNAIDPKWLSGRFNDKDNTRHEKVKRHMDQMRRKRQQSLAADNSHDKGAISTMGALEESLFLTEEEPIEARENELTNTKEGREILQMLNWPLKKNGEPWLESLMLLAIYDQTIGAGKDSTTRGDVLKAAGVAEWDRDRQHQTYFNYFRELDLAYYKGGFADSEVLPGDQLQNWIDGDVIVFSDDCKLTANKKPLAGQRYGSGCDMHPYLNRVNPQRAAQGAKNLRSPMGRIKKSKSANSEPAVELSDEEFNELFGDLLGEAYKQTKAPKVKEGTPVVKKDNSVKGLWRQYMNMDPDEEIPFTPVMATQGNFRKFCIEQHCSPSKVSKTLWGKDYTKGYTRDELMKEAALKEVKDNEN